ncbi:hypothetical protein Nepgr_021504 [Nepenthes gracilis]|uniref:Glucose-methanol-choline oxidoreductase N-terminal domain-containing protein n=1 Tax=Nepenthes gracilis TaxID=150966 RepID=A0AAD3XW48_NEPGR|nr:hypothetical protein Nepgr_021504 [Nepenthes gracilis]
MVDLRLWRLIFLILCGISMLNGSCYSEKAPYYSFVKPATAAPPVVYFDYIIIGGGTAGCALAATLSEEADVLLLERGGSPYGNKNVEDLGSFILNLGDTSPSSPAQQFISEDGVINARARVLGGGSAINAGFFTKASREYVSRVGWDETLVNQSYEWVEKKVAFEPEVLQFQSAVRDGLIDAGNQRSRAVGAKFTDERGIKHRAYLRAGAKVEVIISAGAIGSPQLLMLSGIGPEEELRFHGIDLVSNQPMVGQGMADNPMNGLLVPSPVPVETSLVQVVGITRFGSYIEAASGSHILSAWNPNLPQSTEMFFPQTKQKTLMDSTKGYSLINSMINGNISVGVILEKTIGPVSKGYLLLKTKNPNDNPFVKFNYFKEPKDLARCVKGMESIIKVIQSGPLSKFRYPNMSVQVLIDIMLALPLNLRPRHLSAAASLEQFCKDTVLTIWHYHGGCQVGKVVDKDYKVFGVDGLRVIDGSTFYDSPGTNPQATVMMLGRYMGKKILLERFVD